MNPETYIYSCKNCSILLSAFLIITGKCQLILAELPNMKFNENLYLFSSYQADTCRHRQSLTDTLLQIIIANTPTSAQKTALIRSCTVYVIIINCKETVKHKLSYLQLLSVKFRISASSSYCDLKTGTQRVTISFSNINLLHQV
jgi:hypothetical protein